MKYIRAILGALVLAGCASSTSNNWITTIDGPCKRCGSAKWYQDMAPVSLPRRAVVYSFTGEFASSSYWWLINLDTGEISESESVRNENTHWTTTTKHFGKADSAALENLRASAAKLWRSEPGQFVLPPGSVEFDYVVSGSQQVTFSRFTPDDHYMVTAINVALPADAPKFSGSFVVFPPKKNVKSPP